MGYKRKSKLRSKLMKSIRKTVPTQVHVHWFPTQSRHIDVRPWHTFLTTASRVLPSISFDPLAEFGLVRFDPLLSFMPQTSVTYLQRSPLQQCMNAIRSPNRPKAKLKKKRTSRKRQRYFSPITIPGTPTERHTPDNDTSLHTQSQQDEEDLNLYYRLYNRYRPDIDESNAESADRLLTVETEYLKFRKQRQKQHTVNHMTLAQSSSSTSDTRQDKHSPSLDHHSLSPFQPISGSLTFQTSHKDSPPTIEPMDLSNNVQDIILNSTHSLYSNPDQPLPPQVIDVLYDTGAAISMLPEEYTYAWTNLRECLHTLTGCFA
jgi:hypothetical protein